MSRNSWNLEEIENLARQAVPSLAPQLRERTLAQCAQQLHHKQRRQRQRGWALISTFAAICLLHWAAITALNNSADLPPRDLNQTSARFAMTADEYQQFLQQRAAWMTFADADYNADVQQNR